MPHKIIFRPPRRLPLCLGFLMTFSPLNRLSPRLCSTGRGGRDQPPAPVDDQCHNNNNNDNMLNNGVFANSTPIIKNDVAAADPSSATRPSLKPKHGNMVGDNSSSSDDPLPLRSRRSLEIPNTKLSSNRLSSSWHTSSFALPPVSSPGSGKQKKRISGEKQKRKNSLLVMMPTSKQGSSFFPLEPPKSAQPSGSSPRKSKQRNSLSLSPNPRGRILTTRPPFALPDLTGELLGNKDNETDDEEGCDPLGGTAASTTKESGPPETAQKRHQHHRGAVTAPIPSSLCPSLSKTKSQSQSFVVLKGKAEKELVLETPEGETLLTLDSSSHSLRRGSLSSSSSTTNKHNHHNSRNNLKEQSYIRDRQGELTAVIVKTVDDSRTHRYKICSPNPSYAGQRRTSGTNLFTWAEVKNSTGGLGLQYSMRVKTAPTAATSAGLEDSNSSFNASSRTITSNTASSSLPSSSSHSNTVRYVSEHFGPSLFKWDTPKGLTIRRDNHHPCNDNGGSGDDTHHEPSARMAYMGDARGLVVGPQVDPCLMFCFVTIMDEMIDKRQR